MNDNVIAELRDAKTGELLETISAHNLVVTAGLEGLRDLLAGDGIEPTDMALGTSSTAANIAQTALVAEQYRAAITRRIKSSGPARVQFQLFLGSGQGNGFTYAEAGIFSPYYMLARVVFGTPVLKDSSKTLTITWTVTIA